VVRASAMQAGGSIRFERSGGRTVVARALARSPLRLLTPRVHGAAAWAYTSSFGGGLVDGDAIRLEIDARPGALGLVTTQASTKVYRSPGGCTQTTSATVADGGALALLPDPVACFAGARYAQSTEVALEQGAALVLVDAFTAGRTAYGERWDLSRYESRIRIERGGDVLLRDAVLLDPAHGRLADRMGRFDAFATLVVVGRRFAEASAAITASLASSPVGRRLDLVEVASRLGDDGVVVRIAATSVEAAMLRVRHHAAFVAGPFVGDPWSRKG
jgi:urease accessory protein